MNNLIKRKTWAFYFNKLINEIIIIYFLFFRRMFKKEIYDYEFGRKLHNFMLTKIKRKKTKILGVNKKNILIEINNLKILIRRESNLLLSLIKFGYYEEFTTHLITHLIKKGMNLFDLGANIGYFSILLSNLVGDNANIYAFEPEPNNFKQLIKNILLNNLKNVIPVKKGVSNQSEKVKLYISETNDAWHSCFFVSEKEFDSIGFENIKMSKNNFISIDVVSLDDFFQNENKKISFIKMDIEGNEMNALLGMDKLIEKNKVDIIITEVFPKLIEKSGYSIETFIYKLNDFNFRFYIIDDQNWILKKFKDLNSLISYLNSIVTGNLLCLRKK